ncbi:MAG: hypothetical protein ACF8XB_21080 [Planctomycetota bacterium JB042]
MSGSHVVLMCVVAMCVPANAAETVPRAVAKKAESARKSAAAELLKLAKACSRAKAFDKAVLELERASAVAIDATKISKERKSIAGRAPASSESFGEKLVTLRAAADEKCIALLVDVCEFASQRDAPTTYAEIATLLMSHFPRDQVQAELGIELKWFEPYQCWTAPDDVARYEGGSEFFEGQWYDAEGVAALNAQHSEWSDRWQLEDEVHRVETTMSLRTAKQVLAYVGAYRRFFLREFADEWDLRAYRGKLPVIVTQTNAELSLRLDDIPNGSTISMPLRMGAETFSAPDGLAYCVMAFEAGKPGRLLDMPFELLKNPLKRSLTFQITLAYSVHATSRKAITHQFWCSLGLGEFMQYYVLEEGKWRLSHPRLLHLRPGESTNGAFAYCKENLDSLPSLTKLFSMQDSEFGAGVHFQLAATVCNFLLHGKGGEYRPSFIGLLQETHQAKATPESWNKFFPGVDMDALQSEFEEFVRGLEIDR